MKILSDKRLTAERHELFADFKARAIAEREDGALACKYAETALKALGTREHDSPGTITESSGQGPAAVLSRFQEDLERAYGIL